MSLLKLSRNHQVNFDPVQKSVDIITKFESLNLICEAYLFGSAATNKMTVDSDLDLLLTFETEDHLKIARSEIIHTQQDIAIDWIFKTTADFEKEHDFGGVSYEAYHFGKKNKMTKVTHRKYKKEYAKVLLNIAEGDLKTVRILKEAIHAGRPENILFISQQSIEKSLKSVLVHLEITFPLIHDLGILIALIPEQYAPPFGYDLRELNQFATTRRYEEGIYTLTNEEILAAVNGAEEVLIWAKLLLQKN